MKAAEMVVTVAGPLLGVMIGGWLSDRQHVRGQRHAQYQALRTERLAVYLRFMTAARMWQSNVLEPTVKIATAHTGVPYADAEDAFGDTIRALAELRLVAGKDEIITAAISWERALRRLSEARARLHPAPTPVDAIQLTRTTEDAFVAAVRKELTSPW